MIAEGHSQPMGEPMNQAGQPGVAWTMGRWRLLSTEAQWGGMGVDELVDVRRRLGLTGLTAGVALRTARREEIVRSCWWIVQRWLRTRPFSTRRTRGTMHQAVAPVHPTMHSRGGAAGTAACRQVVVVGDSLGAGRGDSVLGLELVGWADRLAVALRSHYGDVCITNLARSGLTTAEIIRTQLDDALALLPHLIVLTAGGNDLMARTWDPDSFRCAYRALLERLLAGGATVLTTTWHNVPLAVSMPRALARRFSRRLGEASAVVRQVSHELGAPCLDFWHMPDLLDAGCYSSDGIHPNARGYLRVAEVVADGLGRHAGMPVPFRALRSLREHRLDHPARSRALAARGSRRDTTRLLSIERAAN